MKKILVITATLGNRDTLTRTIESVRTVGGDLVHHVIVSPAAAIPAIQEKYGGIDCLAELPGKKGIYAALNHGFQTYGRDYDYLTFINDDDYWLPAYRVLIDAMMNDESLDLAYGRTRYVNENNEYLGSQTSSPRFKDFIGLVKAKNIILLTQQATLIKSRWYFELGGFDESLRLVADSKFWMQLSQKPIRYKYFNRECAAYMIQDGQLSSDHTLQAKEHERLFTEFSNVPPASFWTVLRFRLSNALIYAKRLMRKRSVKNPFLPPLIVKLLIIHLPWCLKRWCLQHLCGYKIDRSAHIGWAFVFPHHLEMAAGARIGHFTTAIHLDRIVMGENSTIGRSNWITGFPTGTDSKHFAHDKTRCSELIIGREAAITKHHHIDCTNTIRIGAFTTIAGYNSQFLTHSIDVYEGRQDSHPITIGERCFVSTGVKILGGAVLPSYSVLAAGAVLAKPYEEEWTMYGGIPAVAKKTIPHDAKYFTRERGYVD